MTEAVAAWRWRPAGGDGATVCLTEVGAAAPGDDARWTARGGDVWTLPTAGEASDTALRWEPDAAGAGAEGLSLAEHGRYLARVSSPAALRGTGGLDVWPMVETPEAALWMVSGDGRAGWARLRLGAAEATVALRARWLDAPGAWRAMLDDLAAVGLAGCLEAVGAEVPVGVVEAEGGGGPEAVWLALREALRPGRLDAALAAIAQRPREALGRGVRVVPWQRALGARPEQIAAARAAGPRGTGVAEAIVTRSVDTPEHRFARFALDDFARALRALDDAPGLDRRSLADAAARLRALRAVVPSVETVRPARAVRPTLALVRHPGYRALWALWRLVRGGAPVLTWSMPDATRAALRDTAALYERWCLVTVARALGVSPQGCSALVRSGRASCPAGTLWSQRRFGPAEGWSLGWRPDLALQRGDRWLLLDAKLRLDGGGVSGPRDAVAKMHAYRDGIVGAWGALALAPERAVGRWWSAPDGGGVGLAGWRPGLDRDGAMAQRVALRERVAAFVRAATGTEAALWSAHDSTDAGAAEAPHPSRTPLV